MWPSLTQTISKTLLPVALYLSVTCALAVSEIISSRCCFACPAATSTLSSNPLCGTHTWSPSLSLPVKGSKLMPRRKFLDYRCQTKKDDSDENVTPVPIRPKRRKPLWRFFIQQSFRDVRAGAATVLAVALLYATSPPYILESNNLKLDACMDAAESLNAAGTNECLKIKLELEPRTSADYRYGGWSPWTTVNNPTRDAVKYIEPPFDVKKPELNLFESAVSGAFAGAARAVSIVLTFPLDTIKTRKQLAPVKRLELLAKEAGDGGKEQGGGKNEQVHAQGGAKYLIGEGGSGFVSEGAQGAPQKKGSEVLVAERTQEEVKTRSAKDLGTQELTKKGDYFAGWLPRILIAIPAQATFFVTHDSINFFLGGGDIMGVPIVLNPRLVELVSSLIACFPSNGVRIPVEAIKQRMQAGEDSSAISAAKRMVEKDGIAGLYKGWQSMMAREIPWNLWQFFTYAELCKRLQEYHGGAPLSITDNAIIGLLAAGSAALVTQPFDVVKTRQMVLRREGSIMKELRSIVKNEGVKNLWLGASYRVLLVGMGGGVYFWAHEAMARFIN